MVTTKTKCTITLDCNIYESARSKYPNLSGRINELLSMDLYGSDEKDELVQRLHELKLEEKSITQRLCELEKQEVKLQADNSNRDKIIDWINETYQRNGVIGLNMLKNECKRNGNLDVSEFVQMMDSEGIAYVKFTG